ncbi:NB-ARC domain-containing protein [Micromonospora palomenae]|uniref:NB-ARC domain-containing protein n=1 Tax=Micromonospora palomenae TaxID=1461247 RepID=UPI003F8A8225
MRELEAQIAEAEDLPGSPGRDVISSIISGRALPALQQDAVTVATALVRRGTREAGRDTAAVADQIRELWVAAKMTAPQMRSSGVQPPLGQPARQRHGPTPIDMHGVGPEELAAEINTVLATLNRVARGDVSSATPLSAALERHLHVAVVRAAFETAGRDSAEPALLGVIRLLGLEPAVLVPRLSHHAEAVRAWTSHLPAEVAPAAVDLVRMGIGDAVAQRPLPEVSLPASAALAALLKDEPTMPALESTVAALTRRVPQRVSFSRDVVPFKPPDQDDQSRTATKAGLVTTAHDSALHNFARVKARLPKRDLYFTGRAELVTEIESSIDRCMAEGIVAFISGQPGVGASAVACVVARQIEGKFPDGTYYVDLRGLHPSELLSARAAIRIIALAAGLNIRLDVADEEQLVSEFRAAIRDREVLIVLDNARDASHVAPFVEPAAGSTVIVTSRDRLQDYALPQHCWQVAPLARHEAIELLAKVSGRADADGAFDRMASLVGDLPLALRLLGARLASWKEIEISALARLLENEISRLDYLEVGDRAVRAAIFLSYEALDVATQRVLRLLPALPGRGVSAAEMQYCLDTRDPKSELRLTRLVDRNLATAQLTCTYSGGQRLLFRLPELTHVFALERLAEVEPSEEVSAFARRSVSYIRDELGRFVADEPDITLEFELDTSRPLAALHLALDGSWNDLALSLSVDLGVLASTQRDLDTFDMVHQERIKLLRSIGTSEDIVKAELSYARRIAEFDIRRDAARATLNAAMTILPWDGSESVTSETYFECSLVAVELEDWAAALRASAEAVGLLTAASRHRTALPAMLNCGRLALHLGDREAGVAWGKRAVQATERFGTDQQQGSAYHLLGLALQADKKKPLAIEAYDTAAQRFAEARDFFNAATSLTGAAYVAPLSERLALLKSAAEYRGKAGKRLHQAADLIRVSAAQAQLGQYSQVATSLNEAAELCDVATAENELVIYEIVTRKRALCAFTRKPPERDSRVAPCGADLLVDLDQKLASTKGHRRRWLAKSIIELDLVNDPLQVDFWVDKKLGEEREAAGELHLGCAT